MMPRKKHILLSLLLLFMACTSREQKRVYNIGIDPAWFSLNILEKKVAVYGFCTDLLSDFSRESGLKIVLQQSNWDTLLDSINRDIYDGVLSGIRPSESTKDKYVFSAPVLLTGPVFVSAEKNIKTISDLGDRSLSVENGNENMLNFALQFKNIQLDYYDNYGKAIYKLSQKESIGILIPAIVARTFEKNLYKGKIFIQSAPLIDEGVRLLVKKGQNYYFLEQFSAYLKNIQGKKYQDLLTKWGLQ